MRFYVVFALFALLGACSMSAGASERPEAMWDFHADGMVWTDTSLSMLASDADGLTALEPADIAEWCPGYVGATTEERAAFWNGLLSALAEHESTWNPAAVGGDGRWFGLVQISPATARYYGCEAGSGAALQDGPANIRCALRIWAVTVERDGVVSAGGGGIAADWGPMVMRAKREEMRAWVSEQSYCAG